MDTSRALMGVGWRQPHYAELMHSRPPLDFLEVHSENFFGHGGAARQVLREGRAHYDISLHGVGLGLGSERGLDAAHLAQLADLVSEIEPRWVSDHACFARAEHQGQLLHAADLLPVPFCEVSLRVMSEQVTRVQERLQRPLLVENLSSYLRPADSTQEEADFLSELTRRSGCGLLVDLNNLYVNALNAQAMRDPLAAERACEAWMRRVDARAVREVHLAGHCLMDDIVIDDHGSRVDEPVWRLYALSLELWGARPTLLEWDTSLPPLAVLLEESARAQAIAAGAAQTGARHSERGGGRLVPSTLGLASAPASSGAALRRQQQVLMDALQARTHKEAEAVLAPAGLWCLDGPGAAWQRGLRAYRSHAAALAERALAAAYPACAWLLGEHNFNALARSLWRAHPPTSGDLADWGGALAAHLRDWAEVRQAEPWLPDMARLEWALHRLETAPDAEPDAASLSALGTHPPEQLRLRLAPGLQRLDLLPGLPEWRGVALDRAAAPEPTAAELLLDTLRTAATQVQRPTLVWRSGWRACARQLDPPEAQWLQALALAPDLAAALDSLQGAGGMAADWAQDRLAAWLSSAWTEGLLLGASVLPAATGSAPAGRSPRVRELERETESLT